MSRKNKPVVSCLLTLMLMLCIVPGVAGRTPRFLGHKEFLPYTRNLPAVYKIELLKLQLKDERWNGEIAATKVLRGAEAQKVAALWRRQGYTGSQAACHEPAYAIKFYSRRKLIAYASVCWSCNKRTSGRSLVLSEASGMTCGVTQAGAAPNFSVSAAKAGLAAIAIEPHHKTPITRRAIPPR